MIIYIFFFFNDTATTEIYTLSLHDALPILVRHRAANALEVVLQSVGERAQRRVELLEDRLGHQHVLGHGDRKSTRLNSSHANISYAVFCLKKNKKYCTPTYHDIKPNHTLIR